MLIPGEVIEGFAKFEEMLLLYNRDKRPPNLGTTVAFAELRLTVYQAFKNAVESLGEIE